MTRLLLAFLLFQVVPSPTGFATGIVLSSSGAPASGVRVYAIPAGDPNAPSATTATVFEGLAQTDASGRYRLEVAAGRYYIAAGSVNSPTYYPNVDSIATAKVVSIAAGTTVEGVNFPRYVLASSSLRIPTPGPTGVLSGLIKNADSTPAVGLAVFAVAVSRLGSAVYAGTAGAANLPGTVRTVTDSTGRYRFPNLAPDTYIIVTGYADSPIVYPGTSDIKAASAITTTPTTMLDNLHFTIPTVTGKTVRVRVLTVELTPVTGESFRIAATGPMFETVWVSVPVGVTYNVAVPNIPPGYKIKSLTLPDGTSTSAGVAPSPNPSPGFAGIYRVTGNSAIMITLIRSD